MLSCRLSRESNARLKGELQEKSRRLLDQCRLQRANGEALKQQMREYEEKEIANMQHRIHQLTATQLDIDDEQRRRAADSVEQPAEEKEEQSADSNVQHSSDGEEDERKEGKDESDEQEEAEEEQAAVDEQRLLDSSDDSKRAVGRAKGERRAVKRVSWSQPLDEPFKAMAVRHSAQQRAAAMSRSQPEHDKSQTSIILYEDIADIMEEEGQITVSQPTSSDTSFSESEGSDKGSQSDRDGQRQQQQQQPGPSLKQQLDQQKSKDKHGRRAAAVSPPAEQPQSEEADEAEERRREEAKRATDRRDAAAQKKREDAEALIAAVEKRKQSLKERQVELAAEQQRDQQQPQTVRRKEEGRGSRSLRSSFTQPSSSPAPSPAKTAPPTRAADDTFVTLQRQQRIQPTTAIRASETATERARPRTRAGAVEPSPADQSSPTVAAAVSDGSLNTRRPVHSAASASSESGRVASRAAPPALSAAAPSKANAATKRQLAAASSQQHHDGTERSKRVRKQLVSTDDSDMAAHNVPTKSTRQPQRVQPLTVPAAATAAREATRKGGQTTAPALLPPQPAKQKWSRATLSGPAPQRPVPMEAAELARHDDNLTEAERAEKLTQVNAFLDLKANRAPSSAASTLTAALCLADERQRKNAKKADRDDSIAAVVPAAAATGSTQQTGTKRSRADSTQRERQPPLAQRRRNGQEEGDAAQHYIDQLEKLDRARQTSKRAEHSSSEAAVGHSRSPLPDLSPAASRRSSAATRATTAKAARQSERRPQRSRREDSDEEEAGWTADAEEQQQPPRKRAMKGTAAAERPTAKTSKQCIAAVSLLECSYRSEADIIAELDRRLRKGAARGILPRWQAAGASKR